MRGLLVVAAVLAGLLVIAWFRLGVEQRHRHDAEEALGSARQELRQSGELLAEVRAVRRDVSELEARIKQLAQRRNGTGETRRENIKTALDADPCAAAAVPDAVADGLYRRAAEVAAGDYSGALTGKPDGKN